VLDVSLKAAGISLKQVLPPTRRQVTYSGVITSGSMERVMGMARKFKSVGFSQYKVKVGDGGSRDRVKAVREILGPDADIRVDANGVWTLEQALSELEALSELGVTSCEEPLGRDRADALPELCRRSAVPIMLDESLVTFEEAQSIASAGACHLFNLRISKCGGITGTLRFVSLAKEYGLGIQIGSHVGETSILSAAARHLAASIEDLRFLEGSFGTLLLSEDIASPSIRFGYRGMAPLLRGAGLGVKVVPERLTHYGAKIVELR
jgi:L-alanine-DL-glutamate epimerase-like enolase superfamily enzyme